MLLAEYSDPFSFDYGDEGEPCGLAHNDDAWFEEENGHMAELVEDLAIQVRFPYG